MKEMDKNKKGTISSLLDLQLYFTAFISISTLFPTSIHASDILGCGGFVRSPFKLDFDKIEIKLFTKQGSLKLRTECAPTTGYYFIPLENKGDYVVKISPPEGWTFDPPEYHIKFDEETDKCSKGEDINFDFKGFSILGKVISAGFSEGPAGVTLSLAGPDGLKLTSVTGEGGAFTFDRIPPGPYSLKASHSSLLLEKDTFSFVIDNRNVVVDSQLVIVGYELAGKIKSDGNPVEKVTVVLISGEESAQIPKTCSPVKTEGLNLPKDVVGKVLCSTVSDKAGDFKFSGLRPGKYTVVPVYKGANIVYNVNPDRLTVQMSHASLELTPSFEVEGFTVQGRVKGHAGAKILVNGEVKATSGHDGTFTIAKMKPGTYDFEVTAEKFQFDKKTISIQPTNAIIPDFVPAKFQTCGIIHISSKSGLPQLNLAFQKKGHPDQIIREKVIEPSNSCVFLSEGSFTAWVESFPEKYFLPEKVQVQIPSGVGFSFKEFTGSISGSVTCQYTSCDGTTIRAENRDTGVIIQEHTLSGGETKFKFENLDSGDYRFKIEGGQFCWKSDVVDKIQLKNANVENISFVQTGVPLEIVSTHKTLVKITGKTKAADQEVQLGADTVQKLCLADPLSPPESYEIVPVGCHEFEKSKYSLKVGSRTQLVATKHKHSWSIIASSAIPDLKITRNGEAFTLEQIQNKEQTGLTITERVDAKKLTVYDISSYEAAGGSVDWEVFSYGFIFEPTSFSIDTLSDCQANLLQVVAKKSHVIKGTLFPPLEGVELRIDLVGDPDSTIYVTSNAEGQYIAGPFVHPSGFKVTPEMPGYTFKALEDDPYSFTVFQLAKIQVKVVTGKELSLSSVLLSISGPNSYRQNKITDENGEMTFADLQPGQYYLKALLKEFQFQPSAITIELNEQETKKIVLKAIRESFSLYGQLSSLSGELMPNLLVSAKGVGNCSEYSEEGTSDEAGNFRIWALKSYCNYHITVVKKDEYAKRVERTVPELLDIKMEADDTHNISFVIITPVRRMDVSLRCHTNNEKALDHLKAVVYSTKSPDTPIHVVPFNGISYIILPPIPKDALDYVVAFESTLNKYQYEYRLPVDINFTANSAYAHFSFRFNIDPAPVDQEIGKNSYIAFALIVLVVLMVANFEKVGAWAKELVEIYFSTSNIMSKKSKSKTK